MKNFDHLAMALESIPNSKPWLNDPNVASNKIIIHEVLVMLFIIFHQCRRPFVRDQLVDIFKMKKKKTSKWWES